MRRITPAPPASDLGHLAEDIRRLFDDLDRSLRGGGYASSECTPPLDVFETDRTLEVRMDVPGVAADSLRVVFKHGVLIIAGAKPSIGTSAGGATFHLVEREFGRFARAVRLSSPVHVADACARLSHGELRIVIPKMTERRGQERRIPVEVDAGESSS